MTDLSVGTKFDQGKLRWDLVPPEFEEVVKVLTFGAKKYADRNWEQGILYGRVIASTFRHLWSWIKGERYDDESGLNPLAHACCDVLFLLTYDLRGMKEFDDRVQINRSGMETVMFPSSGDGLQLDFFTAEESTSGLELVRRSASS